MRSRRLTPFLLSVCLFVPAIAQPARADELTWPDSQPGRCAAAYLRAFNEGTEESLTAFEARFRSAAKREEKSAADWVSRHRDLRHQFGELQAKGILDDSATRIKLLVETAANHALIEMTMEFETVEPHGLTTIQLIDKGNAAASQAPVTPEILTKTLDAIRESLKDGYVFPEVAARMTESLTRHQSNGDYNDIADSGELAERLTKDLQDISHDKHLRIRTGSPDRGLPRRVSRDTNLGWARVEVLPGNIGYVKLNSFNPTPGAMEIAAGGLAFLRFCDALIFDLRDNGGGSPEMIAFISSYLFDKKTLLNRFYNRREDATTETWTSEKIAGTRFDKNLPVYVLTSSRTFSAAEEFTYNLKNLKRATIVGETTGGGAHPVTFVPLGKRFNMSLPYARAINPITKTNWEGVGVEPDIKTSPEKALDTAIADALKKIAARSAAEDEE